MEKAQRVKMHIQYYILENTPTSQEELYTRIKMIQICTWHGSISQINLKEKPCDKHNAMDLI